MKEARSMCEAVRRAVDGYRVGHKFFGNELHNDVARLFPKARTMYTGTILKALRKYRRAAYVCLDHNKSLYAKIKGEV
jgi:hypothetical protein